MKKRSSSGRDNKRGGSRNNAASNNTSNNRKANALERLRVATKRSLKQVSELGLDDEEEDRLIRLIAEMDGVVLKTEHEMEVELQQLRDSHRTTLEKEKEEQVVDETEDFLSESEEESDCEEEVGGSDSNNNSDDDDENSNSSNSDSDESNLYEAMTVSLDANVMTIQKYVKKLVRTDRFHRKMIRTGENKTAEDLAAKIRSSIKQTSSATVPPSSVAQGKLKALPVSAKRSNDPRVAPSPVPPTPSLSSSVRLYIDCEKSKVKAKLTVFDRMTPIEELIKQVRMKFNAGNKFNVVRIVPRNSSSAVGSSPIKASSQPSALESYKILDEIDLLTIPDDETVVLCCLDIKKLQAIEDEKRKVRREKELAEREKQSALEQENDVAEKVIATSTQDSGSLIQNSSSIKRDTEEFEAEEDWTPPFDDREQIDYKPLIANPTASSMIKTELCNQQFTAYKRVLLRNEAAKSKFTGEGKYLSMLLNNFPITVSFSYFLLTLTLRSFK